MWSCSLNSTGPRAISGWCACNFTSRNFWAAKSTLALPAAFGPACGGASTRRPSGSARTWQERIEDILNAIAEIETFIAGFSRDQFLADVKTIKAVVADLTNIGEAASHVPAATVQAHPEIPWQLMTGMRHRIVPAIIRWIR
jgi:uncharacterized protein with HEPN domain